MVLVAWSPSGAALQSHRECALSHVGTRLGMTSAIELAKEIH